MNTNKKKDPNRRRQEDFFPPSLMEPLPEAQRVRSDSTSSSASQGSRSKTSLRQRLSQLMDCIEDLSSDDEVGEEVSRTLEEAFELCGRYEPADAFRLTVS